MVIPGTNRKQSQFDYIQQHCGNYFGAREKVNGLRGKMAKKQQEFQRKQATFIKETAAFTKINALYSSNNSGSPEIDVFKTTLAKDAGLIMSGKTVLAAAKKTWEQRKKKMPGDSRSKAAEWNDKNHQKNEWEKFKKHQVFYLGGKVGLGSTTVLSLVQFNK